MPSDPQHSMDQPLRSYARKRREDSGDAPALHPATRRLLQAEAAKLRPPPIAERRSLSAWLGAFWPRVAFASAVCIALAVTVWNVLPKREPAASVDTMARLDQLKDEPLKSKLAERGIEKLSAERAADQPLARTSAPSVREPQSGIKTDDAYGERVPGTVALQPAPAERRLMAKDAAGVARDRSRSLIVGQKAPTNFTAPLAADGLGVAGGLAYGVAPTPAPATDAVLFAAPARTSVPRVTAGELVEQQTRYYRTPPAANAPAPAASAAPGSVPASPPADSTARSGAAAAPPATTELFSRVQRSVAESTVPLQQAEKMGKRFRYQRSENLGAVAVRREAAPAPLASFDFEQDGDAVRLIEADGSIYAGSVTATNVAAFRVHGTNRALRKAVTVEGEFLAAQATASAATGPRFAATRAAPSRPAPEAKTALSKPATNVPPALDRESDSLAAGRLLLRIRTEGAAEIRSIAVPAGK